LIRKKETFSKVSLLIVIDRVKNNFVYIWRTSQGFPKCLEFKIILDINSNQIWSFSWKINQKAQSEIFFNSFPEKSSRVFFQMYGILIWELFSLDFIHEQKKVFLRKFMKTLKSGRMKESYSTWRRLMKFLFWLEISFLSLHFSKVFHLKNKYQEKSLFLNCQKNSKKKLWLIEKNQTKTSRIKIELL